MYSINYVRSFNQDKTSHAAIEIRRQLIENFSYSVSLAQISQNLGMSEAKIVREFYKAYGETPMKWLWRFRVLLSADIMRQNNGWTLTDIAFYCGFQSSSHFSRYFKVIYGMSPAGYKKRLGNRKPHSNDTTPHQFKDLADHEWMQAIQ